MEGRVGEPIDGDDSDRWAGGGAEGDCNKAAGGVTEGLSEGDSSIPNEGGASRLLVGGIEGPEGKVAKVAIAVFG